jgi:hypothetical protein
MMAEQQTHNYHPILKATAAWADFSEAMVAAATDPETEREARERDRRHHSAAADANWKPPTGAS